jgi:hypothetical protein
MATITVKPDYSTPTQADEGFVAPLDEGLRFSTQHANHYEQERRQSGGLPDSPTDNPVDATDGNGKPYRF